MNTIDRTKLNLDKIRSLPTFNDHLDEKYGKVGTASREKFSKEAQAYYNGQLIEDARKNAHLTQEELANRVGTNKSYISRVENGKTEPRISTFYRIAAALGLSVELNPFKV
jgi:DNA-binding XRE family transcriptional regulator